MTVALEESVADLPADAESPTNPKRILVVEDEKVTVLDLCDTLARLGYHVLGAASSGEEAVSRAESLGPDLVLMDIMLHGEMSGLLAANLIRERLMIPVIFLTAYANDDTVAAARTSDPAGYILKPFQERELHLAIEMALTRHDLRHQFIESEMRFDEIFENPAVGMALVAPGGRWIRVNQTLCNYLGYSRSELVQLSFADITDPGDLCCDYGEIQRLLDGHIRNFSVWKTYRRKEGGTIRLRLTVKLARKADGSPDYFVSVFQTC